MNKKKRVSVPVIGGSFLLVIFAVLCMTVFALLSLSTVLADQRLGDASIKAVSDFYEADSRAEEVFARLRNGELPKEVTIDGNRYTYQCQVSETQMLYVELEREQERWIVKRWQTAGLDPT